MNKFENSRIFVTGGAGFVGSHTVEQLLKLKPSKIFILDNLIRGSRENMKAFLQLPSIEFIEDDIRNTQLIHELMSQSDYCIHLAALRINRCADDQRDGFEVMVKSTFEMIEAAKKFKIKKLVYASSASIYGLAQTFPTPETDHPYDNRTFYGAAKMFGEQLLRSYYHMHGLNYVGLRYFNIYGPRMDTDGKYTEVLVRWLDCIRDGKTPLIFGDGSTSMDMVYIEDVARANLAALVSDCTDEVFNIGCQRETSLKELLMLILKVNQSAIQPEFRAESTVNPVSKRIADVSKAKKLLNFASEVPLEEGMKRLSEWYFNLSKRR